MKKALDWSDYHDQGMGDAYADIPKHGGNYAKAISVCIRSGVCQETNNRGVMCPSFRISNDPAASPGGRVQLLKTLLNQSSDALVNDPEIAKLMDSCVSCKGCKRECENNLDMAAIKIEYLAQKRMAGERSLRSWLFAEFPFLLYRFPFLRSLISLRNSSSLVAKLAEKLLGINSRIPLPTPAKTPYFDSALQTQSNEIDIEALDSSTSVVLLIDTFTALFAPQNAYDAIQVLNSAGYHVITVHPRLLDNDTVLDSGRSLLSQGYVERAQQQAVELITVLKPYVKKNLKVVGLEPSALLILRDEYLMMNLGDDALDLSKQAVLFEEFVAREQMSGRFNVQFERFKQPQILVHGHCHQKAVGAMKSVRKVLRLVPELDVNFIEASCCGMAGSYGLEAEHAQDSVKMAEQGLLPALTDQPDALVVCNGFSCSHQIYALTQRKPLHLATLLANQLTKSS